MSVLAWRPFPRPYREITFPYGRGKEYSLSDKLSRCIFSCFSCLNNPGVATRMWLISIWVKEGFLACREVARMMVSKVMMVGFMGVGYSKYCMAPPVEEAYFINKS